MSVNEVYKEIYGFWSSIYPVIAFHVILYIILKWIKYPFPKISVYSLINSEEKKKKIRDFIETFHLQNILPILLVFAVVGYFALFNVAENTYSSVRSVVGLGRIKTQKIGSDLNKAEELYAGQYKTMIERDSMSLTEEENSLISDPFINDDVLKTHNLSKYIVKYNRWNNLMVLTELLFVTLAFLLIRKRVKRKKSLLSVSKVNLVFLALIFVAMYVFVRMKQEIYLTKIVDNKIALIFRNARNTKTGNTSMAWINLNIKDARAELNKQTKLLNFFRENLSMSKLIVAEDSFLE